MADLAAELGPGYKVQDGKAVRDQCVERGEPIARQAITWVLRGLSYVGYHFDAPAHRPEAAPAGRLTCQQVGSRLAGSFVGLP